MLVLNQFIEVCWCPSVFQHYKEKGYIFTKMRDRFFVKAEDLPKSSHKKIKVVCDYCGKEFLEEWVNFFNKEFNEKDCCKECRMKKFEENYLNNYGVKNPFQLKEVKEKIKQTCFNKYGVENPAQSQEVRNKIAKANEEKYGYTCSLQSKIIKDKARKTNLEKLGVDNPFKSKEIQQKIKKTNEEKYGEGNIAHTPLIKEKIIQNNLKKYGVEFVTQVEEVKKKMRQSLYINGTVASSAAEKQMQQLLKKLYGEENCFENFAYENINMDCLLVLDGIKIDVEYDGWYWHKDRIEKDKKRNYFLIRRGFKVLRFRAEKAVPNEEEIKNAIDYLVKDNHRIRIVNLDILDI